MKRAQKPKPRAARNQAYAEGMQDIRSSNASGPHRQATDYERKPKHVKRRYDDQY